MSRVLSLLSVLCLSIVGYAAEPDDAYAAAWLRCKTTGESVRTQIPGKEGTYLLYLEDGVVGYKLAAPLAPLPTTEVTDTAKKSCECGSKCACEAGTCPATCPTTPPHWFAGFVSIDLGQGGPAGSCTPIHTANGKTLFVTNAHVVPRNMSGHNIQIHIGGKRYRATYLDGSEVSNIGPGTIDIAGPDLCLLSIDAEVQSVAIADEVPAVGELVWQYGFGGVRDVGAPPILRAGRCVGHDERGQMIASYTSVSGDSGAGVLNSRGELCAVMCGNTGANQARAVGLVGVRGYVVRPIVHRLFPRLADRLASKRLTESAPAVVVTPAAPAPQKPAAPVAPTAPVPTPKAAPLPAPAPIFLPLGPSSCPGGVCPNQSPTIFRRWR